MDEERTRDSWLRDTKWLAVYGQNARVKRREFIVLAHGIKVNQVQDQAKAKREIYNQNPKLQDSVEILRVTWPKKLIRSGRTTGPLQISVAEPEQANLLIENGLIWATSYTNVSRIRAIAELLSATSATVTAMLRECVGIHHAVDFVQRLAMQRTTAWQKRTVLSTSSSLAAQGRNTPPGLGNAQFMSDKWRPLQWHTSSGHIGSRSGRTRA
jgi:hypothetical protein